MCLFVQICTNASTWDQGQGESALLVSKKWKVLLSTSDSTSQESESKSCPPCQIFKRNEDETHYSCKKWRWRSLDLVCQEIEEMIITVDKNQDGKISYSEFRVRWTCYFKLFPSNGYDFVSHVIWLPGKGMMWCLQCYGWLTNKTKYQRLLLPPGDVGRIAFDHSRGGPPNCQSVRKSWMFFLMLWAWK